MQLFKYSAVIFCAAFLVGCATPPKTVFPPPEDYVPISQVKITSRFVVVEVTRANLGLEINKCVPQVDANAQAIEQGLQDFPSNNIRKFGHASSAKSFILRKTKAICLQKSSEKFPIFAAEAFFEMANPGGVPPDIIDGWYKQIALLIATKGVAKIAYKFENGNAFIVSYWVETIPEFALSYSSAFKKSGTWETESFDAQFSHPTMTSFNEIKRSGSSRKVYPLEHQFK